MKNLYYLCIKQKNKRPGYPGDDLKSNTMNRTTIHTDGKYDLMFKAYCTALGLKAIKWEEINWLDGTSDINVINK